MNKTTGAEATALSMADLTSSESRRIEPNLLKVVVAAGERTDWFFKMSG
jgi:hypothetical protein